MTTTNFFQSIYNIMPKGQLQVVIKTTGEGQMIASFMLTNANGKVDPDAPSIPLRLRGTPAMLDECFLEGVARPIEKTVTLVSNLKEYDKALEQSRANSRQEKDKKDKETKEQADRRKKYEAQMEKVKQLKEQKKYGEAIGQLPKAADFPEHEEEIKTTNEELRSLHGQLSMF